MGYITERATPKPCKTCVYYRHYCYDAGWLVESDYCDRGLWLPYRKQECKRWKETRE